jgi:DNA-binding transcriptional ArsR family regulator
MDSGFEVLAEPARRQILDHLLGGQQAVGDIVALTGLSQPNTSRHLRILRDAGMVECRVDGQRRLYTLRGEGFAEAARWLIPYVHIWQTSLNPQTRFDATSEQATPPAHADAGS